MSNISADKNNYIAVIHSVCLTYFSQYLLTGNNYVLVL